MAIQLSVDARNDGLDAIQTSGAMVLKIFDGSLPANCAAANAGTELVSMTLPNPAFAAASGGVKAKTGTWSGTAGASGTADYYRLYESDGTTCRAQGTVTAAGGGGDLIIDNVTIASGQTVTVDTFTYTAANA
jgi:hypothetical protein